MSLISREAALDAIDKNRQALLYIGMDGAEHILVHYGRRVIEELPTAEVTLCHLDSPCEYQNADIVMPSAQPTIDPVKHGKWVKLDIHPHLADHKCTACGESAYVPTCMGEPMYLFCPNCGARMGGEEG